MYKTILTLAVFMLYAHLSSFADQVITLKDGSQIKGQLAGIENGVYTVKTPIIGDVHVSAADVANINNTDSGSAPALPGTMPTMPAMPTQSTEAVSMNQRIAAQQQQLLSNPQSMAALQQMAQDPAIMQALQDPALVQAVTNHDYQSVQENPKVQELMSNPKMQALIQELAAQQKQQQTTSPQ